MVPGMLTRLFREPLVHFLLMSVIILAAYGLLNRGSFDPPDRIVVTAPTIEQLASVFAKTWHRPPDPEELKALIDDYVKEEIYSREAKKIGLDVDDSVIRRRLRQKFEFLTAAAADELAPSDEELNTYLQTHLQDFEVEPKIAFEQIYLNPGRRGEHLAQDARSLLDTLAKDPAGDSTALGDATMLPAELPASSMSAIVGMFGSAFADAVEKAPLQQWVGPIKSEFGLHFVRISSREADRKPVLDEVRAEVRRDWINLKRKESEQERLNALLAKYLVEIEAGAREAKP
jgi:hypothetical protein